MDKISAKRNEYDRAAGQLSKTTNMIVIGGEQRRGERNAHTIIFSVSLTPVTFTPVTCPQWALTSLFQPLSESCQRYLPRWWIC